MESYSYKNGALYAEQVPLSTLAARHGTPAFVYSRAAIEANWRAYAQAFAGRDALICYAVKANSNLAILNLMARLGSGFDIVSVGELERVLRAGGAADKVVFSGVGKHAHEIRRALEVGIKCFNVESEPELLRINEIAAQLSVTAPVSIRVNPDTDAHTHPFISTGRKEDKFGISHDQILAAYRLAERLECVVPVGIDCHIGSQVTSLEPYIDALEKLLTLAEDLERHGIPIGHVDIGGGLGIDYHCGNLIRAGAPRSQAGSGDDTATVPDVTAFAEVLRDRVPARYHLMLEPGRSIVGNAGVLLTRVEYLKTTHTRHFAIVDASMNDLLRPSLYQAWHDIIPVTARADEREMDYDVVGPVCETGDFLGLQRPLALRPDDLLAVLSAGAYGFCMSSNYNSRPRAVELLVDDACAHVIRERETPEQLMAGEYMPEFADAMGNL
ncbi:MAG: diaminopimelate decarboxylase [Gammaproteobacteria bacterium]|nr:diaminopimelate decarboxylase [Gammaproteobacteria bacterium]